MVQIEYKHNIGDKVLIIEIERIGIIDALCTELKGSTYRVSYWNDGQRKSEWLYEWEIKI